MLSAKENRPTPHVHALLLSRNEEIGEEDRGNGFPCYVHVSSLPYVHCIATFVYLHAGLYFISGGLIVNKVTNCSVVLVN